MNLEMFGPKVGTGGIDPSEIRKQRIVKPTGILHLPRKEGRKDVADRIDESRDIQAEIAGRLAKEFSEETTTLETRQAAIAAMTQAQRDAEIGRLLRERKRTEEDEILVLLLIAAAA